MSTAAFVSVGPAYKVIRPLLLFLLGLPLIPANWKAALQLFMKVMDTLCP